VTPISDILAEAGRVSDAVVAGNLDVRLTGGVAIGLQCPSASKPPLKRHYADIDLAGHARDRRKIVDLMSSLGYQPDYRFNAIHGAKRLLFWDPKNTRQVDVFLDLFEMCHRIDFSARLSLPGPTLALADLLLMKLQIFETNEKDLRDITALLLDHPFGHDDSQINLPYIVNLVSNNWGLWRTTTIVGERADQFARAIEGFQYAGVVHSRVQEFLAACDGAKKSTAWRLRAKVGDRVRWFNLPEEAH